MERVASEILAPLDILHGHLGVGVQSFRAVGR